MHSTDDRFDPASDTSQTLYVQLRRIAQARFGQLPPSHAVQATDLLHEVWAKLATRPWNDREHFVATFARSAHQILVDLARTSRRRRDRERSHARLRFDEDLAAATWHDPIGHPEAFLLLAEAIDALREESPRAADQLLTHLLLDVPVQAIADSCEPPVSSRSVQRTLKTAKLWIHRWMSQRMGGPAAGPGDGDGDDGDGRRPGGDPRSPSNAGGGGEAGP